MLWVAIMRQMQVNLIHAMLGKAQPSVFVVVFDFAGHPAFGMGWGRWEEEREEAEKRYSVHVWNQYKWKTTWGMTNNYQETLSNTTLQSPALTRLLLLTLFTGSSHKRKTCDWRLLSQPDVQHESVSEHAASFSREESKNVCANTQHLAQRYNLPIKVAQQHNYTGFSSTKHRLLYTVGAKSPP